MKYNEISLHVTLEDLEVKKACMKEHGAQNTQNHLLVQAKWLNHLWENGFYYGIMLLVYGSSCPSGNPPDRKWAVFAIFSSFLQRLP